MSDVAVSERAVPQTSDRALGRTLLIAALPGLTVVNAGIGLLLPYWLGPIAFGRYALIVTLFQYGLVFDFGLSQLIDRRVPALLSATPHEVLTRFTNQVLWLRLFIAAGVMAVGSLALLVWRPTGALGNNLLAALLSLAAGLCLMLVLGPASIWRARSERKSFAIVSIVLNVVLAGGRLVGVVAGGILGCFLCLAACYAAMAAFTQTRMLPRVRDLPGPRTALSLLAGGLPLFLVASVWSFYMTANRWVVSTLASPSELGEFAFAANVTYLIVGAVGALSQFYYPRLAARHAVAEPWTTSRTLLRDYSLLIVAMTLLTGAGMLMGPAFVTLLYAKFAGAVDAVEVLLLAVPALALSSWLMPVSLSLGARPWIDGLLVYPTALAVLVGTTWTGYRWNGISGAGASLFVSACVLLGLQLASLRHAGIVRVRHGLVLFAATMLGSALLVPAVFAGPRIGVGITHLWIAYVAGHR